MPNLVFARNSGVMTNAGVIVMRMGLPSRRRETPITEAAYKVLGVPMGLKLEEPETYDHWGVFQRASVSQCNLSKELRSTRGASRSS